MSKVSFTKEQQQIISERGKNLLVSASAGSGKTTVMIARIIDLMITEHVPISNFLIVTFTKASAGDMKKKLVDKLLELEPTDFILDQIDDVATSDISNLHSFCSRLVSTYFYEVDVDPSYHIIDDREALVIKNRALDKLFERREKAGDNGYFKLFDIFQKRRSSKPLKDIIMRFNNFIHSNINGDEWFKSTFNAAYNFDLKNNACAKVISNYVSNRILEDVELLENIANKCQKVGADNYYDYFVDIISSLKTVRHSNSFIVNAKNLYDIAIARSPKLAKECEFLKEEIEQVKTTIKKHLTNYKTNFVSPDETEILEGLQNAKENIENLYSLVLEFNEIYKVLKRESNGLDFNDLENYTLKILENDAIKTAVKAKYKYVFVDEYQDINEVQEKIISLVSGDNNRFMVGDVKQSIYRFRLSDPEIFLNKYAEYLSSSTSEVIKLNCNFRSDKNILKFVDKVFSGVMTKEFGGIDYASESKFTAGESNLDNSDSVNLCFIDTTKERLEAVITGGVYSVKNHEQIELEETEKAIAEANYVAGKIAELVDPRKSDAIEYSDIAILVSSRNQARSKFIETLKGFNIPVSSDEKYDLLTKNYVQEILCFLRLLVSNRDDILLFKVLKSRLFNFSDNELAEIRRLDLGLKFYECISLYQNLESEELKAKIKGFLDKLEKYREISSTLLVKDAAIKIIEDFSLENINLLDVQGAKIIEEIDRFTSSLGDKSVVKWVLENKDFPLEVENECGGDAVQVMTIHKSKGIEFKAVFVVGCYNKINLASTRGSLLFNKQLGAGLNSFDYNERSENSTIASSAIKMLEARKLVEEQQRVLYVALTRAIEKLYVVCSKNEGDLLAEFPSHPSSFNNWFEPMIIKAINGKCDGFNFESYHIDTLMHSEKEDERKLILTKEDVEPLSGFEYGYKEASKVPLKNSVSKILYSGQEFNAPGKESVLDDDGDAYDKAYFEDAVSSADRGTVYHRVFQKIDLKKLDNLNEQLANIKTEFSSEDWALIDENIIKKIFEFDVFKNISSSDIIIKEREFYSLVDTKVVGVDSNDKFILQGIIDLIIISGDECIILDYKTGGLSDEKLEKYKFQLNLYADVLTRAIKKQVTKKYLCFIDLQKLLEI